MSSKEYLINQGLSFLFELEKEASSSEHKPIKIDVDDLARIHKLIVSRRPFTTLEFGTGFSTIVIAHALQKCKTAYESCDFKPVLTNPPTFRHYSVDANKIWISNTKNLLPNHLKDFVIFWYSKCEICLFNGQISHQYTNLPDIDPQFIYLDGPDPKDVSGNINGLSFCSSNRTVMSSDLLLMESFFTPGTFILVDGRTNNARFLANNFKRKFDINYSRESDITTFELVEPFLGKRNENMNFRY